MTYSVIEYDKVNDQGEPVEPNIKRSAGIASGSGVQLLKDTVCVVVVATVDTHIRLSQANESAAADDQVAEAYKNYRIPVEGKTYVNGLNKS